MFPYHLLFFKLTTVILLLMASQMFGRVWKTGDNDFACEEMRGNVDNRTVFGVLKLLYSLFTSITYDLAPNFDLDIRPGETSKWQRRKPEPGYPRTPTVI
jgi:hypothetical protein